ncbi:MAG: SDR family NAD(P)-dependent oxidoreductase [Nitriliruptor sp.]|uniref:SDR family oxidoreductase n=1 Tax=Nitriliruptor sp. TaxID=2448056 RepID=UPI0034A02CBA
MRTAVVTGASRGLGAAFARVLAEEGCSLALGARDVDGVRAVADELASEHVVEATAGHLDVTDEDSLIRFRAEVVERFGRVDIVVANAGIGSFAPIVATDADDVRAMLEVNVTGLLSTLKTFAADLLAAPTRGMVVVITSDVSARVFPGGAAYVATKHAARAIARTFQQEHPELRVCELRPGATATHFAGGSPDRDLHGHLTADEVAETLRTAISLPDHVRVEELVVRSATQAPDL